MNTIETLEKQLDDLAKQQETLRLRAKAVMAKRNALIAEEHADYYGLTVEQYAAAKAGARANNAPLHRALKLAGRIARKTQVAVVEPVALQTQGVM